MNECPGKVVMGGWRSRGINSQYLCDSRCDLRLLWTRLKESCPLQICNTHKRFVRLGREPWSSGYGRRLMYRRSWVRIPAPYTGWTFFTIICCKYYIVHLKRSKINEEEAGDVLFHKNMMKWKDKNENRIFLRFSWTKRRLSCWAEAIIIKPSSPSTGQRWHTKDTRRNFSQIAGCAGNLHLST